MCTRKAPCEAYRYVNYVISLLKLLHHYYGYSAISATNVITATKK